jgi:4-alpha-glucanotransferase
MKLIFRLRFHTEPGQSLFLTGNHELLGHGDLRAALPLQYLDPQHWQAILPLEGHLKPEVSFSYEYLLRNADGSLTQDWGRGRSVHPAAFSQEEVLILDSWNHPGYVENAFYTEPFRNVLLRPERAEVRGQTVSSATHTFRVRTPLLTRDQTLCLLGEAPALGQWRTEQPLLLNRSATDDWLWAQVDLGREPLPLAYKYGVYDVRNHTFLRYEGGPNRILPDTCAPRRHTVVNDAFAVLPSDTWRGAGVAVPVFSLRSETGFGVGEFEDLKRLADWCRAVGLKLIQILPVNDTTATHGWADSYPYAAISAFALHPIYLNLGRLVSGANRRLLEALEPERKRLQALDSLDYVAVMEAKMTLIRHVYPSQREQAFRSREYHHFFSRNRRWLEPYAAFCCLRDRHGTPEFDRWPACRRYQPEEIERLAASDPEARDAIDLHYFIQFHLHQQLHEATHYARERGVVVKGDIPIGVYRHSADTWEQPELYHLDVQAGAPPDAFAAKGQNWGFPTYNWPRMKEDGFNWWSRRFEQMDHYFGAFRIDHILGFFRIWSIPGHAVEGILGTFVPAIPVDLVEFSRRGIWFDRHRYTHPFISEAVLGEIFGSLREQVRQEFLHFEGYGQYALKPEFATQHQVERHFLALPPTETNQKIRQGLFDLISNVILFEVEGSHGQQFHFRFAIDQTPSFRHLPAPTRSQLMDLYIHYYFRRQDEFWKQEAMGKLPALKRVTNMLICGEDLGLVPSCVPDVMQQLGLLGLEIQRMPKRMDQQFFRPLEAPYLSVVTPSTHDMSTIRGWWEEDRNVIQRFYNQELGQAGAAPAQCEPWINRAVVVQHLASPAMWSIFQLQDLLGMDGELRRPDPAVERINVPANPLNQWRYRVHLSLETLQGAQRFNQELKKLVLENGR